MFVRCFDISRAKDLGLSCTMFPRKHTWKEGKGSTLFALMNGKNNFSSTPKFQFSGSVVSDSLWPNEVQHTRTPCPSPTPRVYPNSCPLSRWCQATISVSVVPFSSCPQSFPASGSFQMSQLFAPGGQSIGVSASTSVLPMNIWNQSVGPCPVLTVASWPAYRFLKRQVRWSGISISFRIFHSLLWSTESKALA